MLVPYATSVSEIFLEISKKIYRIYSKIREFLSKFTINNLFVKLLYAKKCENMHDAKVATTSRCPVSIGFIAYSKEC